MNLRQMYEMGLFNDDRWTCKQCRLRVEAGYLHMKVKKGKEGFDMNFTGRCQKHKKEGDVSLVEVRSILAETPSHNLNHH